MLDGRIARGRHAASPLGRELDSLADVVSFGVAPAAIAFAVGVNTPLDQVILLFFVGCGVSRLARYNVTAERLSAQTGRVKYFEGDRPALPRVRLAHDQQDAAHSQAVAETPAALTLAAAPA